MVAASQSKRQNKLSSAPKCLEYVRGKWQMKKTWKGLSHYLASTDRTIGGSWSGSPTRMNFFAEKSGRSTVLWMTCVDSSTRHTSNVFWVSRGCPEPRQVTPTICWKFQKSHVNEFRSEFIIINLRSYCKRRPALLLFGNRRWGDFRWTQSIPLSFDSSSRDVWILLRDRSPSIVTINYQQPNSCGSWWAPICPSTHANG